VEREQTHLRKLGSGRYGLGHCSRDIVKLQIEKDAGSQASELFDRSGAFGGEELAANLEKASCATQLARQSAGRPHAVNIEGDD